MLVGAGTVVVVVLAAWAVLSMTGAAPWDEEPPAADAPLRELTATRGAVATGGEPQWITGISSDGRTFVDQGGDPVLVRGDAPWSLLTDLHPDEAETYLATRSAQGFNAMLVSLVGAVANGAPSDDGATVDGLLPFVDGDVLRWEEEYFDRAHETVRRAGELGITAMLYPIDSWTLDHTFAGASPQTCRAFGEMAARWAADLPVLWMTGGDYSRSAERDACLEAMLEGIRSTGDDRPFTAQLRDVSSAAADDHWRDRVDWSFVYTYGPTPLAVGEAYAATPARPALLGEANYEGENNTGGPTTTPETLRRQVLWAITSGSPGDVFGTDDWEFHDGWEARLESEGAEQVSRIRDVVASLAWWTLRPQESFLTGGAGGEAEAAQDVLDADLATAAVAPDGSLALVYVPSERAVSLDLSLLAPGAEAAWVDPSTGAATAVGPVSELSVTPSGEVPTPGDNAAGAGDWLLVLGTDLPF
ncbi:apiosidase-like domain-containing protein [Krasilnikoviella flava]|uniref:Putative collagen-binding domain of a collagenase n=1 Tax=Krasilnikoviella flava TaxID=526729 RepID=A0A1T5IE36_9MICO|nr:DUF4038 domain-containing protein [Krasilnikoviella flava]SKC37461.1 Putative collagen-binding domain of a collagenase [Krasilnikoviella flava]